MDPKEYLAKVASALKWTRERTRAALLKRKEKMERGVTFHEYKNHDFVYMKHPLWGTPAHTTLIPNYVGPFQIIQLVGLHCAYKLRLPTSMRFKHPVVHARKLKPFRDRMSGGHVPTTPYQETDDLGNVTMREPPDPNTTTQNEQLASPEKLTQVASYIGARVVKIDGVRKTQVRRDRGNQSEKMEERALVHPAAKGRPARLWTAVKRPTLVPSKKTF